MTEIVNRIAAFKKLLNSLVRQANVAQSDIKAEPSEENEEPTAAESTNDKESTRNESVALTLFGNAANPKQLYSSLQKSVKVPFPSSKPGSEKYVEVQASLREVELPNGITAAKVDQHSPDSQAKAPKRTFGEVFAPRPTLPQLEPPRRARSHTRNNANSWIDSFDMDTNLRAFPGERTNYALSTLPSGQWLQYGGVTSSPSFWNRREKHQSSQQYADVDTAQKLHKDSMLSAEDESSVLQGVFSSFAPSFDSSGAVVQADAKDLVWWSKRGAKRLDALLSVPLYEEPEGESTTQPGNIGELDEETLEEMVNSFKAEDLADKESSTGERMESETDQGSKDLNEMLRDISELLETLSSYQRVRNLDSTGSTGKGTEENEPSLDFASPSNPPAAEREVYETLKSSLSVMISNLPPYAVAKLDGEQLAELNISQKVLVENPDYRGTMEKDDFTLQQERAALVAPAPGSANRISTPRSAGYNQRMYPAGARVQQAQTAFQTPQAYYGTRQPSASGAYAPGHPSYAASRPPATPAQRPGYAPGYSQPTPQYGQGNPVPQFQRPAQNGYTYPSQQAAAPAQASPPSYAPRPVGYNASYSAGRSASPQKPPNGILHPTTRSSPRFH